MDHSTFPHIGPAPAISRFTSRSRPRRATPSVAASSDLGRTELVWDARRVDSAVPGQFRITVPLTGDPVPARSNAALTRMLDQLWVDRTGPRGAVITSVVALIGRGPGRTAGDGDELTLLLTATGLRDRQAIDSADMARQLELALGRLFTRS